MWKVRGESHGTEPRNTKVKTGRGEACDRLRRAGEDGAWGASLPLHGQVTLQEVAPGVWCDGRRTPGESTWDKGTARGPQAGAQSGEARGGRGVCAGELGGGGRRGIPGPLCPPRCNPTPGGRGKVFLTGTTPRL